jgi:hypothetical protein
VLSACPTSIARWIWWGCLVGIIVLNQQGGWDIIVDFLVVMLPPG